MSSRSDEERETGHEEEPRPRERVFRNTIAILAARASSVVFHVLAAMKQARHLGEKEWGLFGYLLSSMEIFRVLTNFGLDIVAIRRMAVGKRSPRDVVRHLLVVKSLLATVGCGAVYALSFVFEGYAQHRGLLLVLAVGLYAVAFTGSTTVRFQAEHQMERLIPVQFLAGAFYLAGVYAASSQGIRVSGFVMIWVGYEFVTLALTALAYRLTWSRRTDSPGAPGFDRRLAWRIFYQGVPVGLLELIVVVYSRLGVFLLEHYGNLEAVGKYYIAIKVTEPLLAIAGALSISAYPVMSRLAEQGEGSEMRRRFLRYAARSALLSCSIAALLTLLAEPLLGTIKPEYVGAAGALVALSWATVFMFQNQLSTSMINSFGKFHYVTGFAAMNLGIYLAFSLALIPRLGVLGAGLSTFGTEGINAFVQLVTVFLLLRHVIRR